MELRYYQKASVEAVARKLLTHRKVVFQLATGGGKTITFSAITKRYVEKSGKSVLILVHRKELLQQTRRTLYNAFGISAQVIVAGMKTVPKAAVYVGMVESTLKRLPDGIGLVIIDEAHNLSFAKMHEHFKNHLVIGFTATPLTASKLKPLKNYYDDIVCGIDIPELIQIGSLCQNITYAPKNVDPASLQIKNGEFDEKRMAFEFSKPKHVKTVVEAYDKYAKHTKALIFNCSINHSVLVNNAFIDAGYNSRHLDSTMTDVERDEIVKWFMITPDAILNNVAILTTGFDDPNIETIIMNRATLSLPLWLQCTGRGSRPTDAKSTFTILDLGGNVGMHGDWCESRDWENIFFYPPKPGNPGTAPVKMCNECNAMLAARAMICKFCGYEFPPSEIDIALRLEDFIVATKGIDVPLLIKINKEKKEYYPFFLIGANLAASAKNTIAQMTEENYNFILRNYDKLAKEWCKEKEKKYNEWHKTKAKETLINELQKYYIKWHPAK